MEEETMADPVAAALNSVGARKERMRRALEELERERDVLTRFTLEWKDLEEVFASAERSVNSRYDDLALKERSMEVRAKAMEEALEKRDKAVCERELAVLAKERKSSCLDEKQQEAKHQEGEAATGEDHSKQQQQQQQQEQEHEPYEPQEVVPSPASQSMDLDLNQQPSSDESPAPDDEFVDNSNRAFARAAVSTITARRGSVGGGGGGGGGGSSEVSAPRPELKALCLSMDGHGLRKFVVDHRKEAFALRHELPLALQCALDPPLIVLEALEAYYPELYAASYQLTKKEPELSANRRACILILECLQVALADPVLGVDHPVVPGSVKEIVRDLAEKWRSRVDIHKDGSSLDAQAFLQLVATFGIATLYDQEELCKLVSAVARRKQTPALCRALGLSAKIPDIVDKLIEEGKQIEALTFSSEFGIMDRIDPVNLLKDYLKEAKRVAQGMIKTGHSSAASQNDATMKELSALRSVLRCIEEHNLEAEFPSSQLQRRISSLERAKMDRKRTGGSVKGQAKRPRGSNNNSHNNGYRNSNQDNRNHYGGVTQTTSSSGGNVSAYPFVSPVAFERQNLSGGYIPAYTATASNPGNRNSVSLQSMPQPSYLYTGADGAIYGAPGFNPTAASSAYGAYAMRGALPPPPPAYQASFMH